MGVLGVAAVFVALGLVLFGMLALIGWLIERRMREHYLRAAPWEPTPRDGCLAVLPVRVDTVRHRPREQGACDCLAIGALPDGARLMLGVSPSAFHAWDRDGTIAGIVPLGRVRSISLIQRAYGILTLRGSQHIVDVDNLPVREGRRHRLRVMCTDQSYAEVAVRPYHDARRFVEIFDRIRDDPRLRVLGALTPGAPVHLDVLAGVLTIPVATLDRQLRPLSSAGLVRRKHNTVTVTDAGVRELAERTGYIAEWSRVIVPPPPPGP
ncbi:winged helix-turn-helix domain-containing protein [Actinoplanes sp. G11-F43]|uniref:winged helix-turn-helix domain-containing protein n=1 Tax=Actinoplanes sp. G11-F43 TaxID=3424130 RepID=UPI003D3345E9